MGEEGTKKLGKRDGAKDILEYRNEGYLPEAMMNFLALIGWNPGTEQEFFTKDELIAAFEIERVQASGGQFDETKLLSVNQHWMRQLSDADFLAQMRDLGGLSSDMVMKAIPLLMERAHTFGEAKELLQGELSCLFQTPVLDPSELVAKELPESPGTTRLALESLLEAVKSLPEGLSPEGVKDVIMPLADAAEAKGKGGRGALLWPLRYALSGQAKSPDPFTLISILGPAESVLRIEKGIAILGE
jgi:glutamyl-tRNA synthetase